MTRLEARYRALLRLLPCWYRADREDEMVAAFLADRDDDLELEYGWPGWREAWAVATLAVQVRQRADAPARTLAVADAIRLVALGGLLVGAAATVGAVPLFVAVGVLDLRAPQPAWLQQANLAASLAVIAALVLLVTGKRTAAKALAALALVPGLIGLITAHGSVAEMEMAASKTPFWLTIGCVFAGFHRAAPAPRARPWLVGGAAAAVLALVWVTVPMMVRADWWTPSVFDPGTLPGWALAIAAGVYLPLRHRDRSGSCALALAIGTAGVLVERLAYLAFTLEYRQTAHDSALLTIAAIQVGLLTAASVGMTMVAAVNRPHGEDGREQIDRQP